MSHNSSSFITSKRWIVLSWLSPLFAFGFVAFLLTASIGQGQANRATNSFTSRAPQEAAQQLICTVSSFFSIDANEQVADVIHIEGRGLASCKNDQGFTTEVPVFADLQAKAVGNWANAGELSFSANSSAFVIPREIGQIQDRYTVKPFDKSSSTLLFEGSQHDLVIEVKLISSTDALQKIEVTGLTLHFDENAPNLD